MYNWNRRTFLKTGVYASAGLTAGIPTFAAEAEKAPVMAIAKYKTSPAGSKEIAEEAKQLTTKAIEAIGGISKFVSRGDTVWVKPNIGWDRVAALAANTNPDVVATIIELCLSAGAKQVYVSDNTCNPQQRTFARSGIQVAAKNAGAIVNFLDKRKFKTMPLEGKVLKEWELYTDMIEADVFINVPIVKHHSISKVTLGMKNLMGVIGGSRNRFHQDIDNTLVDLASFVKPDLIVMDAIRVLTGNGPVGGNPKDVERRDTVAAGTDQVAIDAFGASLLGHQPEDIGHIKEAASRGLGTMDYKSLTPKMVTV